MKRIESLDYLRGLMALAVMIYHYASWSEGGIGSEYLLGKLGIYAVSTFYILSGLSLAIVYNGRINTRIDIQGFLLKRVFRIFPLFWLAVTAALAIRYLAAYKAGEPFSLPVYDAILNYTLLFGFIKPTAYLTTGAWSIGNEIVFYAMFPVIFLIARRSKLFIPACIAASMLVAAYFAFIILNPGISLNSQWPSYINPFNQLFLFMCGIAIGVYFTPDTNSACSKTLWTSVLLASVALFYFYPGQGDKIVIVTGTGRVLLSFACILCVLSVFKLNPEFKAAPAKILGFLGESCYSIYLLHPIIAMPVVFVAAKFGIEKYQAYIASFFITLIISKLTFALIEKPMINRGNALIKRLKAAQPQAALAAGES